MLPRIAALVAGVLLAGCTFLYFPPLAGLTLVVVACAIVWQPVAGLALLFILVPIDFVRPLPGGLFVSFSEFALAVSAAAFLWVRPRWNELDWRPLIWWTPFLGAIAISGLLNIEWYKVAPHLVRNSELPVMAFLTLNVYRRTSQSHAWVSFALGAAVILHTWLALLQFVAGGSDFGPRVSGVFSNPNQLGGFMALVTVTVLALWLVFSALREEAPSTWATALLGAGALTGCLGLFLSASRSALGSALAGAVLMLAGFRLGRFARLGYKGPPLRRIVLLVTFLLLLSVALVQLPLFKSAYRMLHERVEDHLSASAVKRLAFYQAGVDIWRANPLFGVGPGRWEEAAQASGVLADPDSLLDGAIFAHPHNLILHMGALYGLVGVAGLLYAGFRFTAALRHSSNPFAAAGLAFTAVFIVNNLADSLYPSLSLETGWIVGVFLALTTDEQGIPLISEEVP